MRRFVTKLAVVPLMIVIGGQLPSEKSLSQSQSMKYEFPHPGSYRLHGERPSAFEYFYEFQFTRPSEESISTFKDREGNLEIDGAVFVKPAEFPHATKIEQLGEISSTGDICFVNVVRLKFKSANLQLEGRRFANIRFTTETVEGISYEFDGAFLMRPVLESGAYVELTGTLRKFKLRERSEASVRFFHLAFE